MQISNADTAQHDPILGENPVIFWDTVAPDGDAPPFVDAPLGSIYVRGDSGNVAVHVKTADNGADGDWATVTVS